MIVFVVALLAVTTLIPCAFSFHSQSSSFPSKQKQAFIRTRNEHDNYLKQTANDGFDDDDDDDNDDEEVIIEDWRDFRAKLVMKGDNNAISDDDNNSSSNKTLWWAYDAGYLIEKGSILLSRVESTLGCHDLRQPYFHKCVVLILDHDEGEFTKGIVLNRPLNVDVTDDDIIYLDDDGIPEKLRPKSKNSSNNTTTKTWRMNFGGEIAGFYDDNPMIACIHSITTDLGNSVSDFILKDVLVTSLDGARSLVEAGEALPSDFFVFCGFTEWEPGQLHNELKRGSWYSAAARSDAVWEQLQQQKEIDDVDPRGSGLEMWQILTEKIKRVDDDDEGMVSSSGGGDDDDDDDSFTDLMLKEWTAEMIRMTTSDDDDGESSLDDRIIFRALDVAKGNRTVGVGSVVRGSSLDTSPFLLNEQLFHKSTVLVFQENESFSVGLILNLPTADTFVLETSSGNAIDIHIRYGGPSGADGEESLIWLHGSEALRSLRIGKPLASAGDSIFDIASPVWVCTHDQVAQAIDLGFAFPEEFMLVRGFSVWEKEEAGVGGITGQIVAGNFELISPSLVHLVWSKLISQKRLSEGTLENNINLSNEAWAVYDQAMAREATDSNSTTDVNRRFVFGSNVEVSQLSDDALRNWILLFLLGDAKYSSFR
eukprot:CAMPEP_0195509260 /NCGR_PEP_ID=MMETSP0794_2-20130614/2243_1 /TAXON_ID=515487 /ORGANISM="Stephanopyxis turris, Strain CCMP 815" /LENGTH=650 /DNA_ID=CAMNT_0040636429 /DNA_START=89 /DNA_END=2041 /DNA_ORIENTATION=-